MSKWNSETLSRILFDVKKGPFCVIVFSSRYSPSIHFLNCVKSILSDFPSIQLIAVDAEEERELLNIPALNVSEIPSAFLFAKGGVIFRGLIDLNQISNRLKYLSVQAAQADDFEPVGTGLLVSENFNLEPWKKTSEPQTRQSESLLKSAFQPVLAIMESLYDI